MKCITLQQAISVARAGFKKMFGKPYITEIHSDYATVTNPEGVTYIVTLDENGQAVYCSCPFYQQNFKHSICKHILHTDMKTAEAAMDSYIAEHEGDAEFETMYRGSECDSYA